MAKKKANTDERRDQVPVLGELRLVFFFIHIAGWVRGGSGGAALGGGGAGRRAPSNRR